MLSPGLTFLPPRECPRFPQAPRFAGGLRKPGSVLLNEKDFYPIGGWWAKWYGDVAG